MVRLWFQGLLAMDLWLFLLVQDSRSLRIPHKLWVLVTRSADGYAYPLLPLILWVSGHSQAGSFLLAGLVAFAIELPLYGLLKNAVKRRRPADSLLGVEGAIAVPDRFSFPSGHTAAAFLMASLLAHFLTVPAWPFFLWASLVGLSRVSLRVHYPLDVVAGAALGAACAKLSLAILA